MRRATLPAFIFLLAGSAQASLIGFYTFNGNANDSSGNGNNGTVNGTVSYANNAPFGGEALSLDGSSRNNYVSAPIDSSINGQPTETFGGWFYVPSGADTSTIRDIISADLTDFDRNINVDTRNCGTGICWTAFVGGLLGCGAAGNRHAGR